MRALKIQEFLDDGIDADRSRRAAIRIAGRGSYRRGAEDAREIRRTAVGGKNREARIIDLRSRGERADLPRSLIVPENVSELLFYQGTAEAAAKDILADFGALQAARVLKKLVGVQHFIPEELVHVAMEVLGAGSQDGVDVAAAVAPLAGVIQ